MSPHRAEHPEYTSWLRELATMHPMTVPVPVQVPPLLQPEGGGNVGL